MMNSFHKYVMGIKEEYVFSSFVVCKVLWLSLRTCMVVCYSETLNGLLISEPSVLRSIHVASPASNSRLQTPRESNKMPWKAKTKGGRMAVQSEGKESLTGVRWERPQRVSIYAQWSRMLSLDVHITPWISSSTFP